jgi:hypothetical protein
MAWATALLDWKNRRKKQVVFPAIQGTPTSLAQVFAELLECYDSALRNGLFTTKGKGAWLYRFQAGAILYPEQKPLDARTRPSHDLLNSLLFHLAFLFRQATSERPVLRALGTPMLRTGSPHYPLVASLANAVIPNECKLASMGTPEGYLSVKQVRERITRLTRQDVKLANWPQ